ncbi:hypothetical protein [Saccharibacillus sacchari]|uniref:hypothetical protein n=1 Tax=Saccharibacillus sacchari TaxID=456493 RepID=UPI000687CC09|nr:hypothetical protein [Saccharibacillus sacchari]
MSFDLAVRYPSANLTNEQAGNLYLQLCEGHLEDVRPHEAINRFYLAITALHPEIDHVSEDDIDNLDLCPWSIAFDRSPGHLIMSCVWSKAEYVENLIIKTASKHSLAVYNPQTSRYIRPSAKTGEIKVSE